MIGCILVEFVNVVFDFLCFGFGFGYVDLGQFGVCVNYGWDCVVVEDCVVFGIVFGCYDVFMVCFVGEYWIVGYVVNGVDVVVGCLVVIVDFDEIVVSEFYLCVFEVDVVGVWCVVD